MKMKSNLSDYLASVESTEFAIKANGIWLDLSKFEGYEEFESVLVELFPFQEIYFSKYKGIPCELYEKFKADWQEAFEDFKQFEMSDKETQIAYTHYLEYVNSYAYGCFEDFTEKYQGYFATETEFAEHLVDEIGLLDGVDPNLAMYFDYAAYARDLFLNGDFVYCNGYVFSCN